MEDIYQISTRVRDKLDELTSKDKLRMSWPKLTILIHKKIDFFGAQIVKKKAHYSQWTKVHNGTTDGMGFAWWNEFERIIDSIMDDLSNKSIKGQDIFSKLGGDKELFDTKVNYGIFINQDSFIPKVFEATYRQGLPSLVFKTLPHWNRASYALIENNINVTLVDYSTAIAFNCQTNSATPLFFWPFFYFNGWYLLVKKSYLNSFSKKIGRQVDSFIQLDNKEKRLLLEQLKVVVERKTDFEWILKSFCEEFGCKIDQNIVDIDTNEGKKAFVENEEYGMLCTNPLNATDLVTDERYENILTGVTHKNINGLLCKMEFYENNQEVVERLIRNWFDDIRIFKMELKELNKGKHFRALDYEPSFTIQTLVRELNESISSKSETRIQPEDLPILYEHKNHFYSTAKEAFDGFYNNMLNNEKLVGNYIELTRLRLNVNGITDTEIKAVMSEINNRMLMLAKKSK